jgi:hypothetical protein
LVIGNAKGTRFGLPALLALKIGILVFSAVTKNVYNINVTTTRPGRCLI